MKRLHLEGWRLGVARWWQDNAAAVVHGTLRTATQGAYGILCLSAFAPLAHLPPEQWPAALGAVIGSVGANLLSNLLQRDRDDALKALAEAAADPNTPTELRELLEAAIDRSDALTRAQVELQQRADAGAGAWGDYVSALKADLERLGDGGRRTKQVLRQIEVEQTAGRDAIANIGSGMVIREGDRHLEVHVHAGADSGAVLQAVQGLMAKPGHVADFESGRGILRIQQGREEVQARPEALQPTAAPHALEAWLTATMLGLLRDGLDQRFYRLPMVEKLARHLEAQEPTASGLQRTPVPSLEAALGLDGSRGKILLLGDPGGGKSTLLEKAALEAFSQLMTDRQAPVPLLVELRRHRGGTPRAFLDGEWTRQGHAVWLGQLEEVLREGRLLLLADGLNEMTRDRKVVQTLAWNDFLNSLGEFPAGNRAVVSCRSLDDMGGIALKRVEVLPLDAAAVMAVIEQDRDLTDELSARLKDQLAADARRCMAGGQQRRSLLRLAGNPLALKILLDSFRRGGHLTPNRGWLFFGFCYHVLERELGRRLQASGREPAGAEIEAEALAAMDALAVLAYEAQLRGDIHETRQKVALASIATLPQAEEALQLAKDAGLLTTSDRRENSRKPTEHWIAFRHQLFQESLAANRLLALLAAGEDLSARWRSGRLAAELTPLTPRSGDDDWTPLTPPTATGWEETTVLALGLALREPKEGLSQEWSEEAGNLLAAIRPVNAPLAARCLAEADADLVACLAPNPEDPPPLLAGLRADLLADLEDPGVHLRCRLESGRQLGRIGDPRFVIEDGPLGPFIRPHWCKVSAGSYLVGNPGQDDPRHDEQALSDEEGGEEVPLHRFLIARYPVTNAEFRCFWRAGGYEPDERWWDAQGMAWLKGEIGGEPAGLRQVVEFLLDMPDHDIESLLTEVQVVPQQRAGILAIVQAAREGGVDSALAQQGDQGRRDQPRFWDDLSYEDWTGPNQPVIGVSWYEARAYAAWLGLQLAGSTDLESIPGNAPRLPTEAEWEAACRGLVGRRYPWGPDFSVNLANTIEGRVLKVSPVGAYPGGVAVETRALDMSGNVWEWTESLWGKEFGQPTTGRYPYDPSDGREHAAVGPDVLRVVRGGSWSDLSGGARCACRGRRRPSSRDNYLGFRVVHGPPTSSR